MAKEMELRLDSTELTPGSTVSGVVRILQTVEKCRALQVKLILNTKLSGRETRASQVLADRPVRAGEEFHFKLAIPTNAPFTFTGHAHAVDWLVRAPIDVPFGIDRKEEVPCRLQPAPVVNDAKAIEAFAAGRQQPEEPKSGVIGTIILWLLIYPLLAALIIVLLPIVLIIWARQRIIDSRLKEFKLEIPERPALLGEWVPVSLRFRLKKAIHVKRLRLLLQGTEQWTTRSGKSSTTHYHHFYEKEILILQDRILASRKRGRGGEFVCTTHVQIPPDGLPAVSDNTVYYKLTAEMEVRGWPDPCEDVKIPTLSGIVDMPEPAPPAPLAEQCPDIVALAQGEQPPAGVDIATAATSIWFWVWLPIFGSISTIAGIFGRHDGWGLPAMLCGGAALLVGLAGLCFQTMR